MKKRKRRYAIVFGRFSFFTRAGSAKAALEEFFGAAAKRIKIDYRAETDTAEVTPPPFTQSYYAERK